MENRMPRVALVHDWLTGMRGGEKCLEPACRRWPDAKLYTLLHKQGSVSTDIERLQPRVSALGQLPSVSRYYRYLLPLMPAAARWPIANCDLVLSFSHCVAKAAQAPRGVPHVSYCFTPMRYAWNLRDAYFTGMKGVLLRPLLRRLREWDRRVSARVTHFVAISRTIQNRIKECYDRDSTVICPPVDVNFYTPLEVHREDFYLVVSALVPYKRFDLAIEACRRLDKPLVVIGKGPFAAKLKSLAGPKVRFLGWQPDEVIRDYYRRAKALLFPAEEDFGIVPVEAQACGCPVLAYSVGGGGETVRPLGVPHPTGVLFHAQTVDAVAGAIEQFEASAGCFDPRDAVKNSQPYSNERYESELFSFIDRVLNCNAIRQAA